MSDKKELIKKLQALAERGVGGEKEGAQKKLAQLMEKYNINETDLSDDQLREHKWKYHTEFQKRLLYQVMYKIIGKDFLDKAYRYINGKGSKSIFCMKCTDSEATQISVEYDFYCQTWQEEQDFFFNCFIQKHKIFPMDNNKKFDREQKEMSLEDAARMEMAMNAMQEKSIVQRLEGKSNEL